MSGMGWEWDRLHIWTRACAIAICLALGSAAYANTANSAGIEIGNGNSEMGVSVGVTGPEVSLPGSVTSWKPTIGETYTELIAPTDSNIATRTKLRISLNYVEQPDEDQIKKLEDLGWKRFYWADMDGLRMERPTTSRNREIRALEVKLFRRAREAIELVLIGNKKSESYSSLYEWLTPKDEDTDSTEKGNSSLMARSENL